MNLERLAAGAVLSVLVFGVAQGVTILDDDFESYADSAAMQAVWNEAGNTDGTLDSVTGNPGNSMFHPGGPTQNRLFTASVPTDAQPIIWEFDFYDDGEGNKRITGGLRDNGGGAGLNSILEMGRYNDLADPEAGGAGVSGYGVRTVFIGGDPANWVTFVGNPAVQQGWHHFRATIGDSSISFDLDLGDDGTVDATRLIATTPGLNIAYNVARIGGPSNLSSPGGGANFDNVLISQIPEPSTLAIAALTVLGLAVGRRRRH